MLKWEVKGNELKDKIYSQTGLKSFIYRYTDTGFKNKWCGLWGPPLKYLDYYAYKIKANDLEEWLSWDNCNKFILKPWGAWHYFRLEKINGLEINEFVFVPKKRRCVISVLKIKNLDEKKEISITLECGINIREKWENYHEREYDLRFNKVRNSVLVKTKNKPWWIMFGCGRLKKIKINFEKIESRYKEHKPGGSLQRCFLPGNYEIKFTLNGKEEIQIPFIFSFSNKSMNDLLENFDIVFRRWKKIIYEKPKDYKKFVDGLVTPDKKINKTFLWSIFNLKDLIHLSDFGLGIFAGLPWFIEFWFRDSFWSLKALLDIGEFKLVKDCIRTFLNFYNKNYGLPGMVTLNENVTYNFADTNPLFLILLNEYLKLTDDLEFLKENKKIIKNVIKKLKLENYLVNCNSKFTWMDSYDRGSYPIEIQSFWCEALKNYNFDLSERIKKIINEKYWNVNEKYFYDSFNSKPDNSLTINPIIPLILNQINNDKARPMLEKIESEFVSKYGIRTRSFKDKKYSPSGYHTGSVWGLTTGWGICSEFLNNNISKGLKYLNFLVKDMERNQIGSLSEVLNAETGELIGCSMQAWSSALFIIAMDEFLLGIKPNLIKKELILEPKIPKNWDKIKREKRIGNNFGNFIFQRKRNKLEIEIKFEKTPEIKGKLILPEKRKIKINKIEKITNVFEFELLKKNKIEIYNF